MKGVDACNVVLFKGVVAGEVLGGQLDHFVEDLAG